MKGRNKPLSEEDKEEVRNEISNDFMVSYLMQYSQNLEDELARKIEENKNKVGYVVNETPDTEGNRLFDAIMQRYKGKLVFVDFWATWCSPCRSGVPSNVAVLTGLTYARAGSKDKHSCSEGPFCKWKIFSLHLHTHYSLD